MKEKKENHKNARRKERRKKDWFNERKERKPQERKKERFDERKERKNTTKKEKRINWCFLINLFFLFFLLGMERKQQKRKLVKKERKKASNNDRKFQKNLLLNSEVVFQWIFVLLHHIGEKSVSDVVDMWKNRKHLKDDEYGRIATQNASWQRHNDTSPKMKWREFWRSG